MYNRVGRMLINFEFKKGNMVKKLYFGIETSNQTILLRFMDIYCSQLFSENAVQHKCENNVIWLVSECVLRLCPYLDVAFLRAYKYIIYSLGLR
jgi:choline kinase